jgi:hypothetical protein
VWVPAAAVAAGTLVGLALLLWGRRVHRGFLLMIAIGAGLLVGGLLGERLGVHVLLARLVMAVVLGALAIVLARVIWAVLGGLCLAHVAMVAVVVFYLNVPLAATQPAPEGDVLAQARAVVVQTFQVVWEKNAPLLAGAGVAAGLVALIGGFLLPRATVIVMTSMLGACLLAATAALASATWAPSLLERAQASRSLSAAICGGLLLAGVILQSIGEIHARRAREEEEEAPSGGRQGREAEE